jgi:hypothetical protein
MRNLTFSFVIIALCVFGLNSNGLFAKDIENNSQPQDVNISFYGKVIDDSNKPVDGALVYAYVFCMDEKLGVKKFTLETDPNGLFNIKTTGYKLDIKTIRKEGFFVEKDKNCLSFDALALNPETVIFFLKNTGMPTMIHFMHSPGFMPPDNLQYKIDLSDGTQKTQMVEVKNKNLVKKECYSLKPMSSKEDKQPNVAKGEDKNKNTENKNSLVKKDDIEFIALPLASGGYDLKVVSLSDSNGCGILLNENFIDELPGEGYQKEITIEINAIDTPIKKYLYVKAKDGLIYSRLVLDIRVYPESMIVKISGDSNMEGTQIFGIQPVWDSYENKL